MPRKVLSSLAKSNSRCNSLSEVELSPSSDGNTFLLGLELKRIKCPDEFSSDSVRGAG